MEPKLRPRDRMRLRDLGESIGGLLLMALLLAGLIGYSAFRDAERSRAQVQADALRYSREAALGIDGFLASTRQMLSTLAATPAIRDQQPEAATATLAELLRANPPYANIWATRADGWNYASPLPPPGGTQIYIGDRRYFQDALRTGRVSIESIPDSRQNPTRFAVVLCIPVPGADGKANGTVQAGFELLPVQEVLRGIDLPPGSTITVLDEAGYVVARHPSPEEWVGWKADDTPLWRAMQVGQGGTTFEGGFLEDGTRLAGYTLSSLAPWKVVVGFPPEAAEAAVWESLLRALLILTLPALAVVYLAWHLARTSTERAKANEVILRQEAELRSALELKRAQEERERLLTQLETIVESIADALIVCDSRGRITMMNRAALALFGLEKREALRTLVDYLESLQLRDREGGPMQLEELAIARALHGEVTRGREEVATQAGTRRRIDLLVSAAPLKDETGRVTGGVEVATDITRLRELTEEAERRAAELRVSNRELQAFAYSVAHDLRAPLRHINSFSQILLEDHADRLDEQGRQHLRFLRQASRSMGQLIDDLLELSRVTRAEMQRRQVDLSEIARSVAAEVRGRQPERQVELALAPDAVAEGDPQLLRTVLTNLLDNAWKFTSNRPVARIEFGVTEQDGKPVYFVKDNGLGFDMAYVGKLFGTFQRLHRAEEFPGTGIGLATVQRIVQRHGGRVWAEGEVDKGATFYFTLS